MNREEIKNLLPHREPMLLVDEVWIKDRTAYGRYTVKGNEFFLQGHFPGSPVVPGVILCEMMGQSACLLVEESGDFKPYFTGMDKVKFKRKVLPGDTIEFKCEIINKKGAFYFIKGQGYVNNRQAVCGELSFAVIKGE